MATKRKSTEGTVEPDCSDEERARRDRFVWQAGDVTVTRDGVQIHPAPATQSRKTEPKPCADGCGAMTRGGDFLPGHDARHKGRLLTAARSGDAAARAELLERGWATEESIDNAKARLSETERTKRRVAKLEAKAERLRAELAAVEVQLAAATAPTT